MMLSALWNGLVGIKFIQDSQIADISVEGKIRKHGVLYVKSF